jgi:hypothetical protein
LPHHQTAHASRGGRQTSSKTHILKLASAPSDQEQAQHQPCKVKVVYDESHVRHRGRADHSERPERASHAAAVLATVPGVLLVPPAAASPDPAVASAALDKVMR